MKCLIVDKFSAESKIFSCSGLAFAAHTLSLAVDNWVIPNCMYPIISDLVTNEPEMGLCMELTRSLSSEDVLENPEQLYRYPSVLIWSDRLRPGCKIAQYIIIRSK